MTYIGKLKTNCLVEAYLAERSDIFRSTIYWIKEDGELVNLSKEGYQSHIAYLNRKLPKSDKDPFAKVYKNGWIRIRQYSRIVGISFNIPSTSSRAVSALKKFIGSLKPNVEIEIVNSAAKSEWGSYKPSQFLRIYKGSKINSLVKLSQVQQFRESQFPS